MSSITCWAFPHLVFLVESSLSETLLSSVCIFTCYSNATCCWSLASSSSLFHTVNWPAITGKAFLLFGGGGVFCCFEADLNLQLSLGWERRKVPALSQTFSFYVNGP